MPSHEDAFREMHAQYGYPPAAIGQQNLSLPPSLPLPIHTQPPSAVSFTSTRAFRDGWHPPSDDHAFWTHSEPSAPCSLPEHLLVQGQIQNPGPGAISNMTNWAPIELSWQCGGQDKHTQNHIWHGYGQWPLGDHRPQYQRIQSQTLSQGPPHLPGAARYLQLREMQNTLASSSHMVPTRNENSTHPKHERPHPAQPSGRSSDAIHAGMNPMDGSPPGHSQRSPKRSSQPSSPPRGTRYAPLEISPSPEPETKRRKTVNASQTAPSKPCDADKRTGPKTQHGSSRQELCRMRDDPTVLRPQKVRYYAVAVGRVPGVYPDWPSAEKQIRGFANAKHRKYNIEEEALAYVKKYEQYRHQMLPKQTTLSMTQGSFGSGYHCNDIKHEPLQPSLQQSHALDINRNFVPLYEGPVDDGPELVPEQQHVVDLIVQGHNVFYTGSAGCGKSTILKAFVKRLQQMGKRVRIVAPTNLAALNVGGQTTWNFAGWTPDSMKIRIGKLMENSRGKESWKKFDETDVLVIDEISMIENLQFERLNMILKASRGEKYGGGAFGGMQLVVTGDFYQLAPVKPFSRCMCGWELEKDNQLNPKEYRCTNRDCREHTFYNIDKWAFRSRAWEECDFKHVNLTQIHRQSDMMFKSILNRIRTDGVILKPHANVLKNHKSETEGAIEIYARRVDVERVNNDNINRIPSAARTYKCLDDFHWPEHHREDRTLERNTYRLPDGSLSALKEHRFDTRVQVKLNQRVVLQANLDPSAGLVNGAQGTIIEFQEFDEKALPKAPEKKGMDGELRGDHAVYRQEQIKAYADANGRQPWPVVRFTNGITRTIFADCTVNVLGNEEPWCKLSRTQVPLAAGYAITVHKSQGMTLDRVKVDLARAFEQSQIYVALSRARSLQGLTVTALPNNDLGGANVQVKEFMENIVMKKPEP